MKPSLHAVWIWYRGERFRGFQRQVEGPTVQGELARMLGERGVTTTPTPAGRTDRGVHARMQVVSLRMMAGTEVASVGASDLGVVASVRAPTGFHPQWRCEGKEYRYRLALDAVPEAWAPFSWRTEDSPRLQGSRIDPARVAELLQVCVGTHDFIAFHEKSSPRRPRTLWSVEWIDRGDGLHEVRLRGDRFARYQVRYLIGSAVAAAAGLISPEAFEDAVRRGTRIPGLKAPGAGLVLWDVLYPAEVEPFSEMLRREAPGLPRGPPF